MAFLAGKNLDNSFKTLNFFILLPCVHSFLRNNIGWIFATLMTRVRAAFNLVSIRLVSNSHIKIKVIQTFEYVKYKLNSCTNSNIGFHKQ